MNKLNEYYDYPPTTTPPEFKKRPDSIDVKKFRESQEYIVNELASLFHNEWRSSRLVDKEKKEYEPRVKVCIEENGKEKWLDESKVKPTDKILKKQDIANTDFKDLDPYWQKENLAAAKAVIDIILNNLRTKKPVVIDTKFIEEASAEVHKKWIERNSWVLDPNYGNPVLAQPYDKLPEDEKEKDRNQVKKAIILMLTNF